MAVVATQMRLLDETLQGEVLEQIRIKVAHIVGSTWEAIPTSVDVYPGVRLRSSQGLVSVSDGATLEALAQCPGRGASDRLAEDRGSDGGAGRCGHRRCRFSTQHRSHER